MSITRVKSGGRIDPKTLPRGPNGHALCRNCLVQECVPPRKTFHSKECVHEWKLKTRPSYAKACVFKRDRGICCACQTDTKVLAAELWAEGLQYGRAHQQRLLGLHGIPRNRKVRARKFGGGLWDMDHITPCYLASAPADLDGLQTLCIPCHKTRTAAQAAHRAKVRKEATNGNTSRGNLPHLE